jgi:hypothetical protein
VPLRSGNQSIIKDVVKLPSNRLRWDENTVIKSNDPDDEVGDARYHGGSAPCSVASVC